jgi:uncharacterized repeat protein (TIGR02543 family)
MYEGGDMSYSFCKISSFGALVLATALSANAYTIKYNLNGGVNDPKNPTSYVQGETDFVLKDATREGYSFLGWYIVDSDSSQLRDAVNFEEYQGKTMHTVGYYLGSFTVEARWGLVPQIPQQDERGCYLIHNANELYGIASVSVNNVYYSYPRSVFEGCISLQSDIVVNENVLDESGKLAKDDYVSWHELGFKGTFEGNGFKISGLVAERGLFAELGDKEGSWRNNITYVRNLGIEDSYFFGATAGSVAAFAVGPVRLRNVYSNATVHASGKAGGLIGEINVTNDACPTAAPSPASSTKSVSKAEGVDSSHVTIIENAYSRGIVEGESVGGIVSEMDAAVLRNVYFAGELKGKYSDCIVQKKGYACYESERIFEVENAFCMNSKDTSVSHAVSLDETQFADGTALGFLSAGENGFAWIQELGTDAFPALDASRFGIHYVLNGGVNSEQNPSIYSINDEPFALKDAVKEGDEFEGWFTDEMFTQKVDSINTTLYGDWTLYAKWKSFFAINIDLNGGNRYRGNPQSGTLTFKWSADSVAFALYKASRDGYEFEGWYTDSLFTNKVEKISAGNTEDITVRAKWKMLEYTITYHLNGGVNDPENPTAFTVLDSGFVLKEPTREGAEFLYWANFRLGYHRSVKINEMKNLNLYAEWIPTPQQPQKNSKGCYLLTSKEELYWFAGLVNGTLKGVNKDYEACATLKNDIVINETVPKQSADELDSVAYFTWDPIWNFSGKFVGNGHSISGLLVNDECRSTDIYGGLFCEVWSEKAVTGVTVKSSYVMGYGHIDSLVVTSERMSLPSVAAKNDWRIDIQGNRVSLSGLAAGKRLLVMDVQGRVLRSMRTESSMAVELPKKGHFLIRYGSETRAVTIR